MSDLVSEEANSHLSAGLLTSTEPSKKHDSARHTFDKVMCLCTHVSCV